MSQFLDSAWPLPIGRSWRMIDDVASCTPGQEICVRKCFRHDDRVIEAHFVNGPPIVPGVLLIEIAAQAAALLEIGGPADGRGVATDRTIPVLGEAHARFHKPVAPGDLMEVSVRITDRVAGAAVYRAIVRVAEVKVATIRIIGGKISAGQLAQSVAA